MLFGCIFDFGKMEGSCWFFIFYVFYVVDKVICLVGINGFNFGGNGIFVIKLFDVVDCVVV